MERTEYLNTIKNEFTINPVVALLGPRQCGKTTLARTFIKSSLNFNQANYFDLEDPTHLDRLQNNPKLSLSLLRGLVVIDEIQRAPELFPLIRVLVDDEHLNLTFLILGSASKELIRQSSETLAGRISTIEITPFSLHETKEQKLLWLRGGFPKSYLANTEQISFNWRKNYISTFLERDIPELGIQIDPQNLRRFWMMIAHYHGNIINMSEVGNSLSISHTTVKRYLDVLTGTFMIRQLKPWFANITKRQVKQPKIFIRDSGILHNLLSIKDENSLLLHPKLGASWEGMALEQVINIFKADPQDCYFWGVHNQAELDLMIIKDGKKIGFEFKFSQTGKLTPSMQMAIKDLELDSLNIIVPLDTYYPLDTNINVIGLINLEKILLSSTP